MPSRVIHFLKTSNADYVSGEDISRRLNMSRAAVWKHIKQLRAQGYGIEAVPCLGYKLDHVPDKLLPQEVKFQLKTRDFGVHIFHYESIDSTMNQAFKLGLQGAEEGTLVVAESQTQGRGRQGRSWVSPSGEGVYMSLVLRPSLPVVDMPKITLMAAVSISQMVEALTGHVPHIKWPNDILVEGSKISGILTEMHAEMDRVHFLILGIGLNVNSGPATLIDSATSLQMMTGQQHSRVLVLQRLLVQLEKNYHELLHKGFASLRNEWCQRSSVLKQKVRLKDGDRLIEGVAVDLAEDGGLLIQQRDGQVVKKMSGDVLL